MILLHYFSTIIVKQYDNKINMRIIAIICILVVFNSFQQESQLDHEKAENSNDELLKENLLLKREISENDSIVNSYASYINKVRENLHQIREHKGLIVIDKKNPEQLSIDNAIQEIEIIGNLMVENDRLINQLKSDLKNSDMQLGEFEKTILSLSEEVQIKNREIYYLQQEMESMDASLGELFDAYNEKVAELDVINDLLNTGWFTIGSKSELLNNGIITKEGGVIGIGRTSVLKDDFNKSYFTKVNINEFIEIPLGVKSVDFITSHPKSSYELIGDSPIKKVKILDSGKFWSISKHLVIMVK